LSSVLLFSLPRGPRLNQDFCVFGGCLPMGRSRLGVFSCTRVPGHFTYFLSSPTSPPSLPGEEHSSWPSEIFLFVIRTISPLSFGMFLLRGVPLYRETLLQPSLYVRLLFECFRGVRRLFFFQFVRSPNSRRSCSGRRRPVHEVPFLLPHSGVILFAVRSDPMTMFPYPPL